MPQSQQSRPPASAEISPLLIHASGVFLFLFIPLVLFLFLQYPLGILRSFALAIGIIIAHRFVAIPFLNRFRAHRCLWCGRTSRARETIDVDTGTPAPFQFCKDPCAGRARRFFDFVSGHKMLLRAGIFLPLAWYVITMLLQAFDLFDFPIDWNRFIFRFFIACTVVSISFLHGTGKETQHPAFPFPIHNTFLLGTKNTLLVFRLVGIWWIAAGLHFLYKRM